MNARSIAAGDRTLAVQARRVAARTSTRHPHVAVDAQKAARAFRLDADRWQRRIRQLEELQADE